MEIGRIRKPSRSHTGGTLDQCPAHQNYYTLTANDPKHQVYGGLESGGLEAGGLEARGLEAGATDVGSGALLIKLGVSRMGV